MQVYLSDHYELDGFAAHNVKHATDAFQNCGVVQRIKPNDELSTGNVYEQYRISDNFVIVEEVFVGNTKSFLQTVKIFTRQNQLVHRRYSIREHEYHNRVSEEIVADAIRKYNARNTAYDAHALQMELIQLYPEGFISQSKFIWSVNVLQKMSLK